MTLIEDRILKFGSFKKNVEKSEDDLEGKTKKECENFKFVEVK